MAGKGSLTKLDVGVLSPEQQEKLHQFKVQTRIDNERYLRSHPEVDQLIGDFLRSACVLTDSVPLHAYLLLSRA
uniref:RIIa domain-containing protein n=1 Tax=Echeneis naucrates TaxID=173247 RepID=A0A665UZU8_ECHNA